MTNADLLVFFGWTIQPWADPIQLENVASKAITEATDTEARVIVQYVLATDGMGNPG